MPLFDNEPLMVACAGCNEEFGVGGMRPGVRDGAPVFRCASCSQDFLDQEAAKAAQWAKINERVEMLDQRLVAKADQGDQMRALMLQKAFEAADMEAVADELTDLFGGNKGIAQALFAQWVHAAAMKPGGRLANEAMKLIFNAVHVATQRRPPMSATGEMTDEALARELVGKPALLQLTSTGGTG
jgi:hypothetical protein